jgi:hypothetical protein
MMRIFTRGVAVAAAVTVLLAGGSAVARADERPNPGVRSVRTLYSSEVTVSLVVDHVKRSSQQDWIGHVFARTFAPYVRNAFGSYTYSRRTQRLRLLDRWEGKYTAEVARRAQYLRRTRPWYHVSANDKTVTNVDVFIPVKRVTSAGAARLDRALPKLAGVTLISGGQREPAQYSLSLVVRRKLSQANLNDVAAAIQRAVHTKPSRLRFVIRNEPIGTP